MSKKPKQARRGRVVGGVIDGWDADNMASSRSMSPTSLPSHSEHEVSEPDEGNAVSFADGIDGVEMRDFGDGEREHAQTVKLTWARSNPKSQSCRSKVPRASQDRGEDLEQSLLSPPPHLSDGPKSVGVGSSVNSSKQYLGRNGQHILIDVLVCQDSETFAVPEVVRTKIIQSRSKAQSLHNSAAENSKDVFLNQGQRSKHLGEAVPGRPRATRERPRYKTSDLPLTMQRPWTEVLIPAARELVGSRDNP